MESPEICHGGEKLLAHETDHDRAQQTYAATVAEP
jgi:hypothetical protein